MMLMELSGPGALANRQRDLKESLKTRFDG